MRITELHYAPPGGKLFEFIELKNIGTAPLDLTGVHFSDGVDFAFTGGNLAPGAYGILVAEPGNFPGLNVLGTYTGALNNGGEQLTLRDPSGENILSFDYGGDWFPPAREGGYSIVIRDDSADWSSWDLPASWALSCDPGGSPSAPNPEPYGNAYFGWSAQFFSPAELADPLASGADADASGDGVSNLIKYALGLDPTTRTQDGLPAVGMDGGFLTLSFRRLQKAVDLTLVVEVSTDLGDWQPAATKTMSNDHGDGTETVTFRANSPITNESRQFMRLKVIQN